MVASAGGMSRSTLPGTSINTWVVLCASASHPTGLKPAAVRHPEGKEADWRGRLLWLLIWWAGADLPARAGDFTESNHAPFLIRSYQHDQGLPNNTVNAITQTHDGYLWLGTDEGLARFDGLHYRVFGLQDGLKNLQISALLEDSRHVLWIGTAGGGVGRMVQGQIKTYTVQDGLAGDSISSLVEATNGEVWVGTHTGLSRWRHDTFEPLAPKLNPMLVFDLAKDRHGDIWAATLHNGSYEHCLLRSHHKFYDVFTGRISDRSCFRARVSEHVCEWLVSM